MATQLSETTTTALDAAVPARARPASRVEDRGRPAKRRLAALARTVLLLARRCSGWRLLLGVLFGPEAQPVDLAAAQTGDRRSSPSRARARPGSSSNTTSPRRSAGHLRRVTLKAGDPVAAERDRAGHHRPAGAAIQRRALGNRADSPRSAPPRARWRRRRLTWSAPARSSILPSRRRPLPRPGRLRRHRRSARLSQYTMEADTRRAAMDVANKLVDQRQAELDQAHALLMGPRCGRQPAPRPVMVKSPITGRVLDVTHESETVVTDGPADHDRGRRARHRDHAGDAVRGRGEGAARHARHRSMAGAANRSMPGSASSSRSATPKCRRSGSRSSGCTSCSTSPTRPRSGRRWGMATA